MKKLKKNKFVVLIVCVIIVSLVYFAAQKAIDSYVFNTNSDIVSDGADFSEGGKQNSTEGVSYNSNGGKDVVLDKTRDGANGGDNEERGQFSDEEINLVFEDVSDINEENGDSGAKVEEEVQIGNIENKDPSDRKDSESIKNKIYVYITGEVNVPGVVILDEGSRIADAINAAGGTTAKANVTKVNLVYVLDDGMKVNIPNNDDLKNNPNFEYITLNSGDGGIDDYRDVGYGAESSSDGGGSGSASGSGPGSGSGNYKKHSVVNINTATQTELESLPGIGPSLALKIINYRKENGKFSSIEEIKCVSGIGESKFETLKRFIVV